MELEEEPTLCTSSPRHAQCCCESGEHLFPEHHHTKILRQAGSNMGLRCFCHCFPPKFSNVCTPFPRTRAPKEGASEPGSWKLTACSKDLWWSVLGMSWNGACLPWASVRQSVEEEMLRLGQSNLTSSLKKRHVAALPRTKSNHEAFCSTPSQLWFSGAYWQVCRILWVSDKQVHICFTFSLSNWVLIVQEFEKTTDQIREIWKPVESVSLNTVVTVWSLKDLIFVHNETKPVWWTGCFLEHMGLWSLIYAWPSQRRSVCMCLLNGNIALSGARWNYGLSGSCTLFLWGISWYGLAALLAQGTGRRSSGGWNPVKGKTNGKLRGLSPWQKFNSIQNTWFLGRKGGISLEFLCFVPDTFPATV